METALIVLFIVSIVSNGLFIYNLKKLQPKSLEFTPVLESLDCDCRAGLLEEVKEILLPLLEKEPVKAPAPPDESHFAWKNQKEEPQKAAPSPHGPPPIPGPLERPYGFSR